MNADQIYQAYCYQLVEIQELTEKLKKWEACADRLIVYAKEIKSTMLVTTTTSALYEAVCQDIEKYKKLKNG